ncbi:hypothetical protein FOCC_FOCC016282 [Frankliniella occidentalis]|nr:hypothetical protein FOCC_FOCC016282 [Frankliniella occidentalis]
MGDTRVSRAVKMSEEHSPPPSNNEDLGPGFEEPDPGHVSDNESEATSTSSDSFESANEETQPNRPKLSSGYLLQNIDPFSGGDEIQLQTFLDSLKRAARLAQWGSEELLQIAVMKLRKDALEYYNASDCRTWKELVHCLKERFGSQEPRAITRRKLNACFQRPDESPMVFGQKLRTLMCKVQPPSSKADARIKKIFDENLMDRFVDGLQPKLRRIVISRRPASFKEALEIANFEHSLDVMEGSSRNRVLALQADTQPVTSQAEAETIAKAYIKIICIHGVDSEDNENSGDEAEVQVQEPPTPGEIAQAADPERSIERAPEDSFEPLLRQPEYSVSNQDVLR